MKVVITSTGEFKEPSARVKVNGVTGPDCLDYLYLDFCRAGEKLACGENGIWYLSDDEWEDMLDTFRMTPAYWNSLFTALYHMFPGLNEDERVDVRLVFREDE